MEQTGSASLANTLSAWTRCSWVLGRNVVDARGIEVVGLCGGRGLCDVCLDVWLSAFVACKNAIIMVKSNSESPILFRPLF